MQKIFLLIALFILAISFPGQIQAAKKFVPKKKTVKRVSVTSSIPAVVRYRGDKQGILISFSNFSGIESVSYSFTYMTNGLTQGAGGTITSANNPAAVRELLFGTCSGGVCRYHRNLSQAKLLLTAKLKKGITATKSYRIKTYQ